MLRAVFSLGIVLSVSIFAGFNSYEPPPEPSGKRIAINDPTLQHDSNFLPQESVSLVRFVDDADLQTDEEIAKRVRGVSK